MSLRVNGERVTAAELEAEYRRLEQACRARLSAETLAAHQPELRAQARDFAIGRRLLLQEARRREERSPDVVQLPLAPREEGREADDEADLGELGGLDGQQADVDPSARAVDRRPEEDDDE